jgi:ASCH domain
MNAVKTVRYALSLKQPWAALVVHGVKSIEIRRWPTARRGRILIHASSVVDDRPEGWRKVPQEAKTFAEFRGGIIGSVELTDCVRYENLQAFLADQAKHHNEADWFQPPVLYGFAFADPTPLPFQKYPGWFRFFKVESAAALV